MYHKRGSMIWAVSMMRDEADIVERTVTHMLSQVDAVLIADNGSTDGTREILEDLPVLLRDDPDPAYYQSKKMTALAHEAIAKGAKWVVPFDGDEIWLSKEGRISDVLPGLPADALVCEAQIFDHVAVKGEVMSPWRRRLPLPLRKVAVRAHPGLVIHQGNHGATFDRVEHPLSVSGMLEVRHFPYRSPEQMIRKARNGSEAYAATDLPESTGQHWREYGRMSDAELEIVFETHFFADDPESRDLVFDPCGA